MAEELTLEKLRVSERVQSLEDAIKNLIVLKERDHRDLQAMLQRHDRALYGNGQEGLITRFSKHEQSLTVLTRVLWAMATVLISLGLKAVFDKLVLGVG